MRQCGIRGARRLLQLVRRAGRLFRRDGRVSGLQCFRRALHRLLCLTGGLPRLCSLSTRGLRVEGRRRELFAGLFESLRQRGRRAGELLLSLLLSTTLCRFGRSQFRQRFGQLALLLCQSHRLLGSLRGRFTLSRQALRREVSRLRRRLCLFTRRTELSRLSLSRRGSRLLGKFRRRLGCLGIGTLSSRDFDRLASRFNRELLLVSNRLRSGGRFH